VDASKDLKTTLMLSPPPSGGAGGGGGGGGGGFGLGALNLGMGAARLAQSGVSMIDGGYPDPWMPADLTEVALMTLVEAAAQVVEEIVQVQTERTPPLFLPDWMGRDDA